MNDPSVTNLLPLPNGLPPVQPSSSFLALHVAQAAQLFFNHFLVIGAEQNSISGALRAFGVDLQRMRGEELIREYIFDNAAIQTLRHGMPRCVRDGRNQIADGSRIR